MSLRLTLRRLRAMENAVSAMEAGEQGEGDWDPDISREDMEAALEWVVQQISKRRERERENDD